MLQTQFVGFDHSLMIPSGRVKFFKLGWQANQHINSHPHASTADPGTAPPMIFVPDDFVSIHIHRNHTVVERCNIYTLAICSGLCPKPAAQFNNLYGLFRGLSILQIQDIEIAIRVDSERRLSTTSGGATQ